jgi:transcriptional regulator with XRE-family HTH domain
MESKVVTEEREGFSNRLVQALAEANVASTAATLVAEYNLRADGAAVTPYAARKWLNGESIPTQEKVHILARWLGVSASWLRFGDSERGRHTLDMIDAPGPSSADLTLLRDFHRLSEDERGLVLDIVDVIGHRRRQKENNVG